MKDACVEISYIVVVVEAVDGFIRPPLWYFDTLEASVVVVSIMMVQLFSDCVAADCV